MDFQQILDLSFATLVAACIAVGLAACGDPDLPEQCQASGGGVERMFAPTATRECKEVRK